MASSTGSQCCSGVPQPSPPPHKSKLGLEEARRSSGGVRCSKERPQLRANGFIHHARQVVEHFPALRGLQHVCQGFTLLVEVRAVQKLLSPPMVADRVHVRSHYPGVSVKLAVEFGDADCSIMPARRHKSRGARLRTEFTPVKLGALSVMIVDAKVESVSSRAADGLSKLIDHAAQTFQLAAGKWQTATAHSC
jgi:hypothetical protein